MSTIVDQSSLVYDVIILTAYSGKYSGSTGNTDYTESFGTTYTPPTKYEAINSTANLKSTFNTYYKLTGYNPANKTYETWHCRGTIQLSPPSGNLLQDVHVITSWVDR